MARTTKYVMKSTAPPTELAKFMVIINVQVMLMNIFLITNNNKYKISAIEYFKKVHKILHLMSSPIRRGVVDSGPLHCL